MNQPTFEPSVFHVRDPACSSCNYEMDFTLIENYLDSGIDWLQWCCKNTSCGKCVAVQIL
ncbi:MAG: hypothetical protein GYA24_10140 [Candidatus Lokiarchaeota archaeon]|nr:hypothetical protein [Candidatus Lokiarchaeota archaeon]